MTPREKLTENKAAFKMFIDATNKTSTEAISEFAGQDTAEIQLPVIAVTEKAIAFNNYRGWLDKEAPVWIPKSQVIAVYYGEERGGLRLHLPTWLIRKAKLS